jgi:hypothetical protein
LWGVGYNSKSTIDTFNNLTQAAFADYPFPMFTIVGRTQDAVSTCPDENTF